MNDQAAGVGAATYAKFAAPYGSVNPGQHSNLMHYPYHGKLPEVENLVKQHGYKIHYAGGKFGKPDLANKNYNTGHLMIYDPTPASGGDFGHHEYTNAWRQTHELAHALTYPEVNKIYGEGRRIDKLGTHRSLNEAMRAVHWEHLAAHKQRELNKQLGIQVPDDVFNKEYNTVMHDAIHRAVTGQFTEPSQEGFVPHGHAVPLSTAMDILREEAGKLGLQHPHATLRKGWPRNEQENQENMAAPVVMQDSLIEHGANLNAVNPREKIAISTEGIGQDPRVDTSKYPINHYWNRRYGVGRAEQAGRNNEIAALNAGTTSVSYVNEPNEFKHSDNTDRFWNQITNEAGLDPVQRSPILKRKKT
jgi:hypothetical protein